MLMSYSRETRGMLRRAEHAIDRPPEDQFRRFLGGMALARWSMGIGQLRVEGIEHLQEAASLGGLVVATSHITDRDPHMVGGVVANVLRGNVGFTVASTNLDEPFGSGYWLAGRKHFYPVPYRRLTNGDKEPKGFNGDDYGTLTDAIRGGTTALVAAYTPIQHNGGVERPGLVAPYLALAASVPVLPVAVNIEGQAERPGQYNSNTLVPNIFDARQFPFFKNKEIVVRFGPQINLNTERWSDLLIRAESSYDRERLGFLVESGRQVLSAVQALSRPF